ncbi:MAG: ABC transporter permease [Cyclobacteriaceae bacterium]
MLRSFLTITFRVLWRNKVTTCVNILSLAIGITSFIFIMLYVHHELSYDKFNENYDRIYRLEGEAHGKLPPVIGPYLKDKLPEIENIARLAGGDKEYLSYTPEHDPVNQKYVEAISFWADSTTFEVFTFPFIHGDPHTALKEPFTVVLTESTARKLFGNSDPMTKGVVLDNHQFTVTGIIKDVKYSHIEIDALFSQESILKVYPLKDAGWSPGLWSATYLLMTGDVDRVLMEKKINAVLTDINDGILFDIEFKYFQLRALSDIYFRGTVQNLQYGLHGNLKLIKVLRAIGVFMLVLACINYVNLTTARSVIRAREIAIKRVAGSSLRLLRYQLILESVIVSVIGLVVALTLVQVFLPAFNLMAKLDLNTINLNRAPVWAGIVSSAVLLGVLAGIYPAFYLTAAKPVALFKGGAKDSGRSLLRTVLMTFQFTISVVMIIGIITNLRQMHFVRNADLGFTKEQVITINTPADFRSEFSLRETFRKKLQRHAGIVNIAYSAGNPGGGPPTGTIEFEGIKRTIGFFFIDDAYLDVMDIQIAEGRSFSAERPGDRVQNENWSSKENDRVSVLLNQTAVDEFGMQSPLGKLLYWTDRDGRLYEVEIIGIVRDFHFRSLHHRVEPLFIYWTAPMSLASIKIHSPDIPATLKQIEKEWKNVYGQKPFVYQFLDETFDRQYRNDEQLAAVIGYFTALAVIIACLGLFGLSSYMVSRRTKEIGIRKSLGATMGTIYFMLSWDFLRWILVAVLIACPVGWYLMNRWLESFAYHIRIGADIFIIAASMAVLAALLTVTWQSLKAANANPINALRYE